MTRTKTIIRAALAAGIAAMLSGASPAFADSYLDGLTGSWQGSGFVRVSASAPEENIRCRLNATLVGNTGRLNVLGTCSVAGYVLPVNGYIRANAKAYEADLFQNLAWLTTSAFTGQAKGALLQLRYQGRDSDTNEQISAAMTIAKKAKAFDISLSRTDPQTKKNFDVGTIRFKAR
jgi:hypothetical protein